VIDYWIKELVYSVTLQKWKTELLKAIKEMMKANQEEIMARLEAKIEANQAKTDADKEADQEERKAEKKSLPRSSKGNEGRNQIWPSGNEIHS
jgi:regulator of protease activity HflC (stomatin/prohibitin superfamily)